jgi:hypothetical protein
LWEYQVVVLENEKQRYYTDKEGDAKNRAIRQQEILNECGSEGWELGSTVMIQTQAYIIILAYLKRQK